MKTVNVAIMGIGTVGGGTYEILTENHDLLLKTQGIDFKVKKVLDKDISRIKRFGIPESAFASSIDDILSDDDISIVVETMGGVEPAKTFIEKVLLSGKSIVTANKELIAKHWPSLEQAAKKGKAGLYFEASCVGGVPIIRALQEGLQANNIEKIIGIINGTTNYILTKMTEENMSYAAALKEAQNLGFAEFNPTADVDGFDASYKLSILSSLAFNTCIPITSVYREGITGITVEDIAAGKELGYVIKLLAIGKKNGTDVEVRVHPAFVPVSHPLASVGGSFNAVFVKGDFVDELMFYGRGAGARPTGSAIVSDIVYASKRTSPLYTTFENNGKLDGSVNISGDFTSKFYISVSVKDIPGVLSSIAGIFASNNVSIESVVQKGKDGIAFIRFLTHAAKESEIRRAISEFSELDKSNRVISMIRVLEN
ncbi:MAG: homoserine dehydrogenase [Clostridia bacterium]|nr:homoserine dehydrogenase [Clostridia bacterium]